MRISLLPAVAVIATGALIGGGTAIAASASSQPVKHKTCATFYIQAPDVNPPPVHLSPATPELLFFTFCGQGIKPGKWFCPVRPGQQITDRPLACKH